MVLNYGEYIYTSTDSGISWTPINSIGIKSWTSVKLSY